MKLSYRLDVCNNNVTKYESGKNFNMIKRYEWQDKANAIVKQMNALPMKDEDFEAINEFYGC